MPHKFHCRMGPSTQPQQAPAQDPARRGRRFLINVLWNWTGTAAGIFTGLILSPFIIHRIGDERYGLWSLAFALIEYLALFDLGFRTAVVIHASRYRAQTDTEKINSVVNTASCYFLAVAGLVLLVAAQFSGEAHRFFRISPEYRRDFSTLLVLTGASCAGGVFSSVFQGCLEAFQGFKAINSILTFTLVLRAAGLVTVLLLGYGMVEMGIAVIAAQIAGYVLNFLAARRIFPELRFSRRYVQWATLKDLAGYGIHSFVATVSNLLLNQGPVVLAGHYLPGAFVGYYSLPARLMQYTADAVTRVGFVMVPNTAEMTALGRAKEVVKLGVYVNRYCFTLFLPFSLFLLVYGRELIRTWVGPTFALHSAPVLIAMVLGTSLAIAAQFNSSQILYGMARHRNYARSLMVEAVLLVAGLVYVIPRHGIVGIAWLAAALMIINRGCLTPWMVCRYLDFSFSGYMASIYARPLLTAAPVWALLAWLKASWLPGSHWLELIAAIALTGVAYYAVALLVCLERDHRALLRSWIAGRLHGRAA